MESTELKTDIVLCCCTSPAHQLVFTYETADNTLYLYVHLNKANVFKRIIYAIKYILGTRSIHGSFAEVMLKEAEVKRIQGILNKFLEEGTHVV